MSMWRFGGRAAAALSVAAIVSAGPSQAARRPPPARAPVVVELFTAQGCQACPQANALLQELTDKPGVLALTFPLDVWDYLGWADTLAKPEFTARQKAYVARFKLRELYTPEMVVQGRRETLGFEREKVMALLARAQAPAAPRVKFSPQGTRVTVGPGPAPPGGADVWLVRYDPVERTVKVRSGENKGKTVVQQNVVRDLQRLGGWTGRLRTYRLPTAADASSNTVVLVQGAKGGPMLAAARAG